jgi:hypothetical protein
MRIPAARSPRKPCRRPWTAHPTRVWSALGIEIEARYAVGEYDILILTAAQSDGVALWLRDNSYRLPAGAEAALSTYVADGMRFFLARVNLEEQSKLGYSYLRPLQVAFESEQLVLPIRLGMLNAAGPQELLILLLTQGGRVEPANYRTVEMPSDIEVPLFVKGASGEFYTALFDEAVARQDAPAAFVEYAGDLAACDPCAPAAPSFDELRELGAFWMLDMAELSPGGTTPEVFVTRLHLRYDAERFPEDLRFRETADRSRFQARYVLRHPWRGSPRCEGTAVPFDPARRVRAAGAEPRSPDEPADSGNPGRDGSERPALRLSEPRARHARMVGKDLAGQSVGGRTLGTGAGDRRENRRCSSAGRGALPCRPLPPPNRKGRELRHWAESALRRQRRVVTAPWSGPEPFPSASAAGPGRPPAAPERSPWSRSRGRSPAAPW